jgi:lipid A 4'-phosphatase
LKKVFLIFLALLLVLIIISLFGMDIKVSKILYEPVPHNQIWPLMYKYGNILPNLCGIIAGILLIISFLPSNLASIKKHKKKFLFVLLLFIIAPGIIVQTTKITWGRPRPVETKEFGGKYEFRTPFSPNIELFGNKNDGNSFPSGHAANGFFMMFPFYILKKRKALIFGSLGLIYGTVMSLSRIIQGGHFLSDVVTSLFIVYITAEVLKLLLYKPIKERTE